MLGLVKSKDFQKYFAVWTYLETKRPIISLVTNQMSCVILFNTVVEHVFDKKKKGNVCLVVFFNSHLINLYHNYRILQFLRICNPWQHQSKWQNMDLLSKKTHFSWMMPQHEYSKTKTSKAEYLKKKQKIKHHRKSSL